jgi:hypothetical protein
MPLSHPRIGLRLACIALAVATVVVHPVFAGDPPTLTVKVEFKGEGGKKWGTPAERAAVIAKLDAQLKAEWGQKVEAGRPGKSGTETIPAVNVTVSEGTSNPANNNEVGVIVHDMDDADKGNYGSYEYKDNKVHIYPKNMKDAKDKDGQPLSSDLTTWIEKTSAHELGHYACADDNNESAEGATPPNKMAQSGAVQGWAERNGKSFDSVNADRTFRQDVRTKQMRNLGKVGPQCKTAGDFFKDSPYANSLLIIDDPPFEEAGIINFAITAIGQQATTFDLGIIHPGVDLLPNTPDDQFLTKWFGNNEMLLDWTPDNGIDDIEHFAATAPDLVVSLFERSWYSFGVAEISSGNVYPLSDFGQVVLSDPEFNAEIGREVFGTAELVFDLNRDRVPDLQYTLSNDLTSLATPIYLGDLYHPNKYGTGFTTTGIPEPTTLLMLAPLFLLRRRAA